MLRRATALKRICDRQRVQNAEGKGQYGTMPFIVILENNLDSYRILSCNEVRDGLL